MRLKYDFIEGNCIGGWLDTSQPGEEPRAHGPEHGVIVGGHVVAVIPNFL